MNMRNQPTKLARLVCAGLAAICVHSVYAQEIDLGTAGQYAAFILGDVSALRTIEGRLAVGRDLDASKLDIGSKLPAQNGPPPSLIVGRNIKAFSSGNIWANGGKKGYGLVAGSKSNVDTKLDLRTGDSPIDFHAEAIWLTMLSAQLRDKTATGTVSVQGNTVTLQGKNADLEIFTFDADQVSPAKTLKLSNIKSTAYLVLNVLSDKQKKVKVGLKQDVLKGRESRVLFNFPDADVLRVDDGQIQGSALAPYACVTSANGRIEGTIVSASWNSKTEIGNTPFVAGP